MRIRNEATAADGWDGARMCTADGSTTIVALFPVARTHLSDWKLYGLLPRYSFIVQTKTCDVTERGLSGCVREGDDDRAKTCNSREERRLLKLKNMEVANDNQ